MKPPLTNEQMNRFSTAFNAILSKESVKVQSLWIDNGIRWAEDIPHFHNNVHLKLSLSGKNEFYSLMNKLKGRAI